MKKALFFLSLAMTIAVIILPIEPKPLGWLLSFVCGYATGKCLIDWRMNKF